MNVVNVMNVLNVTIEKEEEKSQNTIHMLESGVLMRWTLTSYPIECCEFTECNS